MDDVVIVGGGICGLALALNLHARGIGCRVFERAPAIRELGVGITLLPHAMRELTALGLGERLAASGIETRESAFFNRFGQLIYREARGRDAGYPHPEVAIHRGRLQVILHEAVLARLGPGRVLTDHSCVGVEQDELGATALFTSASGEARPAARGGVVVGCDGINSTVRQGLVRGDAIAFTGITMWRGVTRRPPILDGRTYLRIGSIRTGKMVIYPIQDEPDGTQLVNWVAEIQREGASVADWSRPGRLDDVLPLYEGWRFPWLDVPDLIRGADAIFEYPMVDKDPLERWTHGRVTLAGDAAHPMYPRGSNGSAQGLIDARVLAERLAAGPDPGAALAAYETERRPATTHIVRTNREQPPDFINIRVEDLVGDRPFDNLDDHVSQDELRALSDAYKQVAGFAAPERPDMPGRRS